jgi:hypothetical protein
MLARAVSATHGQALFIVAFASPLLFGVFHHSIHPSILSVFLIPAALAMYHRKGSSGHAAPAFAFLAIVLTFLMVFFHPVTALIMLIILLVFGLGNLLVRRFSTAYAPEADVLYLLVVLTVSLFAWLNPFSGLEDKLNSVMGALLIGDATPMASHYGALLSQANLSILGVAELVMNQYGQIVIYLLATGIALLLVLWYFLSKQMHRSEFYYSLQVIAGIGFTGAMIVGYFIEFEPIRVARYAIIVIPVLCGLAFYHYAVTMRSDTRQKLFVGFMLLLIFSASIFAVFSVYYSPRVVKANTQLTSMEMTGTEWYFDRADLDTPLIATDLNLARYEMYRYGYGTPEYHAPRPQFRRLIPSRFGYDATQTLVERFDTPATYMITTEMNRLSYLAYPEGVRPIVTRYLSSDFVRLSQDQSVMQAYANGEFEVWYISAVPT